METEGGTDYKEEQRIFWGMIEMFVMITMVGSQVYTYVQTNQVPHF